MTGQSRKASVNRLAAAWRETLALPARAWRALRSLSGDDAYERYREHARQHPAGPALLDRRRFYLREQERRFNGGPTSCC
jgi:uncharacterized short protein YbdD (DUF466 family)